MAKNGQKETLKDRALDYLQKFGIVQLKEFIDIGVPSIIVRRLLDDGKIANPARGVYVVPGYECDPLAPIAIEAISAPPGVISLLTAASLQGLIQREPKELWLAVPSGTWTPKELGFIPLRCLKWSCVEEGPSIVGPARGIPAIHDMELLGRLFPVTTPARTVVDLFSYRSELGTGVCEEALANAIEHGTHSSEIRLFAASVGLSRAIEDSLERVNDHLSSPGRSM